MRRKGEITNAFLFAIGIIVTLAMLLGSCLEADGVKVYYWDRLLIVLVLINLVCWIFFALRWLSSNE